MSHLGSEYVKSSKELTFENKDKKVTKCIYELHDGNFICIECTYVPEKRDDGSLMDWKGKMESCKSFLCNADGNSVQEKDELYDLLKSME